ncbi:MAG TPA: response regulator, partial [Polyangia bacterium]|nr:response regulator [Polyangia bacterium]
MGSILLALVNEDRRSSIVRGIERLTDHVIEDVRDAEQAFIRLSEGDCDLAIIDADQPGLDGFGLCRRLHQQTPRGASPPVVFLAVADASTVMRRTALATGADDCLVLPVTDEGLCERISGALRARRKLARPGRPARASGERRRRSEELALALRAERDTLRETFDVFDEALLLMESSGQVLVANAAGRRLNHAALANELQALARDAVGKTSVCDRGMVGGDRSYVGRAYPVSGGRVLVYVRDVTEERGIEMSRLQAEKLTSIGTLAAGVAHEINNPAAFVLGNLESLASNVRLFDEQLVAVADPAVRGNLEDVLFEVKAILQETKEGMARIHRIVRDLSAFSHLDDDRSALGDVNAAVESTLNLLRSELRHRCTVERDLRATRAVVGSPARLGQVLLNLIQNATQALDVTRQAENRIAIRTFDSGSDVIFEVTDNGTGIAADVLPRIFDSFFTTKPRGVGTGLGLPITQGIVRSLGGDIAVETRVGVGTTFRVRLPSRPRGRVDAAAAASQSAPKPVERRRILAIDDEPLLLKAYRRMLTEAHDVVTALGGRDALLVLQKAVDFDAILCDLQMPEMSGMELFEKVKARYPELAERFIFVTGGAFSVEAKTFLENGVPYVGKPFRSDELMAVLEARIAEREAAERSGPTMSRVAESATEAVDTVASSAGRAAESNLSG